jgi:hypothetical protein
MKHYDFAKTFHTIYDSAVAQYAKGSRDTTTLLSAEEKAFLAANGITAQHLYDYAEDHNNYAGEPGFEIALGIELIRRDYFLNVQNGKPSSTVLDESKLPAKTDSVRGIEWLPRIIPKVKAKLRGELPSSLMYCCGGDRKFLKAHNILPAELLAITWRNLDNDAAIVDWVAARSTTSRT